MKWLRLNDSIKSTLLAAIVGILCMSCFTPATLAQTYPTQQDLFRPSRENAQFVSSASCHFKAADTFGVFAVFRMDSGTYQLWWLSVYGNSSHPSYGQINLAMLIARDEPYIGHVDCVTMTEPGFDNIGYVVWDRSADAGDVEPARFTRVEDDGVHHSIGRIRNVPDCGGKPAIGVGIDNHEDMLVISAAGRGGSICWYGYRLGNTLINSRMVRPSNVATDPGVTDVKWNGRGNFLVAALVDVGSGPALYTQLLDEDGAADGTLRRSWLHERWGFSHLYTGLDLIRSDNPHNVHNLMVAVTDTRLFYLLDSGVQAPWWDLPGAPVSPVWVGPWETWGACEYHGPRQRIAQTYSPRWPIGSPLSRHQHWNYRPWWAMDIIDVPANPWERTELWPTSCSAGGSSDPEVLLVSRKSGTATDSLAFGDRLYLSIHQED